MPDDLTRRAPEDRQTISLRQQWEVDYWTSTLGVSEEALRRAIRAVGHSVTNVRHWLRNSGYQPR